LSGAAVLTIQIVATVVLARLLAPKDFGVVAMVTTFSFLLINFGLNGFTEAVVQCESISHQLASTLFWINLGCGALLTVGFAASGSLLAWFYKDPLVRPVAAGISLTIFLTSASVMHLALLKRAMRFSEISGNDIRARVISVAVSIALGVAGWAYWSLVAGAVVLTLSQVIGAWILCPWLPGLPRRVEGLGRSLRFALHTYGSFTVNYASRNTDNLLVGWRFSAQSLGFYKKAYDLFALSASQLVASISVVVVGALSRVKRDMVQYRRYLLAATTVMAFIGMGVGVDLTLVGKDVIRLLLGPAWAPAGKIFTFFGPGIGVMILYYTHSWIHLSIGRPERWFRWTIVEFVVTVTLFIVALSHGPVGIAIAWTASFWILTVPALWYAGRPIGLGVMPTLSAIWRYLAASLIAGFGTTLIVERMPGLEALTGAGGAFLRIVVVSAFVGVMYVSAVIVLHGGFAPIRQIALLVKDMVGKRDRSIDAGIKRPAANVVVNRAGDVPVEQVR
jgi:O-antigen/teichoic acid export membrane protein